MSSEENNIECFQHGKQPETYVCQHIVESLRDETPRGFHSANIPGKPRPDSWCSACEAMVSKTGEWDDESEAFARVTLLCGICYDRAKLLNTVD